MMWFWDAVASGGPYANSLWVWGDLRIFHRNVSRRRLTVLQKNILGYFYVDPFGYVNTPDESTITPAANILTGHPFAGSEI